MSAAEDPRRQLHQAFDQASRVVAGVTPDQLGRSTPCTEFDVRALSEHLVGVARRVASVGHGEPQAGRVDTTGIAAGGLAESFDEARRDAFAAWADDAILTKEVSLPFGTFPGAVVAAVYTLELTTHSWDLASSTEQLDLLDPALADVSLAVAMQAIPPEPRGGMMPFGPVIEVPEGSSSYDRLAGYLGRTPA